MALSGLARGLAALTLVTLFVVAALIPDVVTAATPLSYVLLVGDTRVLLGLAVASFGLGFVLYLWFLGRERPENLVHGGRSVEALVPVYEESESMHKSVQGLVDAAYEQLTITIVPEPDDGASRSRARELAEANPQVRVVVNDERQGTKAGALNYAIDRSDAEIIGIFDADQEPHPNTVSHAVAALADADIASAKSMPRPTGGFVESEGYYEFLTLFFLPQQLAKLGFGFEFVGSQSVFLDASVFETVGLYDEDTLTEDMDFTRRCHQAGMAVTELNYYPCLEEPVHSLRDWWGQRVRWMTGHLQVSHKEFATGGGLSAGTLTALVTFLGTLLAGCLLATTLPKLLLAGLDNPLVIGAELAGIYAVVLGTRLVDNRTAGTAGVGVSWLFLPVFVSLYGLVILSVFVDFWRGRGTDWHHVSKGT